MAHLAFFLSMTCVEVFACCHISYFANQIFTVAALQVGDEKGLMAFQVLVT
jgi:hypothetical protein